MNLHPPLSAFEQLIGDALPAAARQAMETHVIACAECTALLGRLKADPLGPTVKHRRPLAIPVGPAQAAPPARPPAPPAVPGYELIRVLGRGGMGVVYEARQISLNRHVALKMIRSAGKASDDALRRFRAEADAVARLDHPNIVRIYEFGDVDGDPFFSLELVAGGPLSRRLAGNPQPAGDAAQVVEVLARAVQFAHERGVVHRDLKPANVLMVQPGDKVTLAQCTLKVSDFGLAKCLGDDDPALLGPTATASGVVLGTPAYMAPEQAAGLSREVGPVSDVYALGAILYELLTGRPPFRAASVVETLDQVRTQEPVPPSRLRPNLPRDLETICLKCLRKEPARRYASALALADDLRRYLDSKPILARPVGRVERARLWYRRSPRRAAAAGLIACLLLFIFIGSPIAAWYYKGARDRALAAEKDALEQKDAADEQRRKAERTAALALALDGSLIFDLHDRLERLPGTTPVREHLVRTALDNLERVAQEAGEEADVLHGLSVAYCKAGDVQGNPHHPNLNDAAGADRSYRKARDLAEAAVGKAPSDPAMRRQLMICRNKQGEMAESHGRPREAADHFQAARALADQLAQEAPTDRRFKNDRAVALSHLARLHMALGETPAALDSSRAALDLFRELEDPADRKSQWDLAVGRQLLGEVLMAVGERVQAREQYQESHRQHALLAQLDPKDPQLQRGLLVSHNKLGEAWMTLGDLQAALGEYEKGRAVAAAMRQADRQNAQARRDLATSHERIGDVLAADGQLRKAYEQFEESRGLRSELANADPANVLLRTELSVAHEKIGDMLFRSDAFDEALKWYEQARAQRADLVGRDSGSAEYQWLLSVAENKVGDVHARLRHWDLARESYEKSRARREKLAASDPDNVDRQRHLVMSLQNVADTFTATANYDEAWALYSRALDIARRLVRTDEQNTNGQRAYAVLLERVGAYHEKRADPEQALSAYQEAHRVRERHVNNPGNAGQQRDRAIVCDHLARVLTQLGRVAEAGAITRQAQALRDRLPQAP